MLGQHTPDKTTL